MTVSVPGTLLFDYAGDGVTTSFPYTNFVHEAADLVVILEDADGVQTVQTLDTHYTVSGAGTASVTATFVTAPAAGEKVYVYRDTARKQTVDLEDAARNPANTTETQLDRLARISQDLGYLVSRSPKTPAGAVALAEGHFYETDAAGNLVDGGSSANIKNAQGYAVRAETAADEAEAAAASVDYRVVADRATAKLLNPTLVKAIIIVGEGGRNGTFALRARSAMSASELAGAAADVEEGVYFPIGADHYAVRQAGWAIEGASAGWWGVDTSDADTAPGYQIALDACAAIGIAKLFGVPGENIFSSTLNMVDGVEFYGNRKATIKRADSAVSLLTLVDFGLAEKASMKGWTVDGNRSVVGDGDGYVDIRIGGGVDSIFNENIVKNNPGYAVVVNTGRDIVINNNVIFNFGNAGIVVFPSGLGDRQVKEVCGNYIHRAGWGALGIGSARALVQGNVLEGVLIGGRDDRLIVNTSGTTVTRVSGPDFSEVVPGNWMTINGGMEFRIASVDSLDQLTTDPVFNGTLPTLSGAQASVGSGDLMGVNGDDCIVTDNILEKAATFLFGIAGGGKRIAFIGNKLRYAGKCAIVVHDGADTVDDCILANNNIDNPCYGGGIGATDRFAIFVYGTVAGRVNNTQLTGNIVTSSAGEGQAEYWLGTNAAMSPGSIVANGNQARGLLHDTISGDILSIELSAGWGSTATTPYIRSTGDTVHFDVHCSGTGFATQPTYTVTKVVEKNGWKPIPDSIVMLGTGGGGFGIISGQYLSDLGVWKGIVGVTPGDGHIYSILVKN